METKDYEFEGRMYRSIHFDEEDIAIYVEAYQYAEDEAHELDLDYEYEGEYYRESFKSLKEAVLKCKELLDKKWEVVRLFIRTKGDTHFYYKEDLVNNKTWADIEIDLTEINKELSDKLARIKNIVEG